MRVACILTPAWLTAGKAAARSCRRGFKMRPDPIAVQNQRLPRLSGGMAFVICRQLA
jgi:hypothetical protein